MQFNKASQLLPKSHTSLRTVEVGVVSTYMLHVVLKPITVIRNSNDGCCLSSINKVMNHE